MEDGANIVEIQKSTSSDKSKKKIRLGVFEVDVLLANIVFACLTVIGEVGEGITLPLWIDSAAVGNHSKNNSSEHLLAKNKTSSDTDNPHQLRIDGYFVFSFACAAFVIIFGVALLFVRILQPGRLGEPEKRFPHRQLVLIGLVDSLHGVMIVFSCSGERTPPHLQAILGNFTIPMVIGFRFLILRKLPTVRKFICAMAVMISLFICLSPKIFNESNPKPYHPDREQPQASGPWRFLWPLIFMLGFMPDAFMTVLEEKGLKMELTGSHERVNMVYFLFWTHFYQFVGALCLFWLDLVPSVGYVNSMYHFWENWSFGFKCFFGGAGCKARCAVPGTIFILMYVLNYVGVTNLVRFSEGATLVAVVSALVTPLGFIFWTLFQEMPFKWDPTANHSTWFSIGSLLLMVPAIYFYNTSDEEEEEETETSAEQQPLLPGMNNSVQQYS